MSIMDFFRGTDSAAQAAQNTQQQQPAQQQQQQQQQEPNSGTPTQGEVSGLDAFKDIWQNEPVKEGEQEDPEAAYDPSAGLNINPEEIQKQVAQMNFAQVLDTQTLAKIGEGGEEAQKAFAESLNKVSQYVFSQSMIANATLVKQALANSSGVFDARAERLLKQSKISDATSSQNPVFNHPAAQPMVKALQEQLARKHPQASHEEIAQKANQMFASLAEEFTKPQRDKQNQQSRANEPDWEDFFNS